jgi:hypothetical protein
MASCPLSGRAENLVDPRYWIDFEDSEARVEPLPGVRGDCFAGEILATLENARTHAQQWCREDYGWRERTARATRSATRNGS